MYLSNAAIWWGKEKEELWNELCMMICFTWARGMWGNKAHSYRDKPFLKASPKWKCRSLQAYQWNLTIPPFNFHQPIITMSFLIGYWFVDQKAIAAPGKISKNGKWREGHLLDSSTKKRDKVVTHIFNCVSVNEKIWRNELLWVVVWLFMLLQLSLPSCVSSGLLHLSVNLLEHVYVYLKH